MNVVTFCGAQGTGKTTMKEVFVDQLRHEGKVVIDQYPLVDKSIARDATELGFRINKETNFVSQYYIALDFCRQDVLLRHQMDRDGIDVAVLDRSALDVIPYACAAQIDDNEYKMISDLIGNHLVKFESRFVYCEPIKGVLVKDKHRSDDIEFQTKINDMYVKTLAGQDYHILRSNSVQKRLDLLKRMGLV